MTSDDIIRIAREAGFNCLLPSEHIDYTGGVYVGDDEICGTLERFAALVAAAEREECAAFLETGVDMAGLAGDPVLMKYTFELLTGCAAAIRARWNNER